MTDFPVEEARSHVEALGNGHGITIIEIRQQWKCEADLHRRTIYITDPTTPLRYLLGLHEIGHIVDKVSAKVMFNHIPCCEAAAWAWAIENAAPELPEHVTNREWRLIGRAWVSQLHKAARVARPTR